MPYPRLTPSPQVFHARCCNSRPPRFRFCTSAIVALRGLVRASAGWCWRESSDRLQAAVSSGDSRQPGGRSSGSMSEASVCSSDGDDLAPSLRFQLVDTGGKLIIEGEDELTDFDFRLNDTFRCRTCASTPSMAARPLFPPDIVCDGLNEARRAGGRLRAAGLHLPGRAPAPSRPDTTLVCALEGVQVNVNPNDTVQFVDQRDAAVVILSVRQRLRRRPQRQHQLRVELGPDEPRTSHLRLLTSLEDTCPPANGDIAPTDLRRFVPPGRTP